MPALFVDGREYAVAGNQPVLEACLGLGFDLPYFCWHPAMGSVGACRQCAVMQYKDEAEERSGHGGKLVMACMTAVGDGVRVALRHPEAERFRAEVIEGMMLHHPHDCPVCDEGGQCHLQDMTVMTGHSRRRYRFAKRTFRNQYLGPLVNHEMNRCIQCYRCVRFYREYAGGRDLEAQGIRDQVYFGRREDGALESGFAGNLAEVCPTGVFTDATLKQHYTRKWDLRWAPSVCPFCAVGCNISPGERYGRVRAVVNRYHPTINGYFLCDRGRYGYQYLESRERVLKAPEGTAERLAALLAAGGETIGIGSPRASLESNFALRQRVGAENFYSGEAGGDGDALAPCGPPIEQCDAALVLGEDVSATAPRWALSLRQMVRNQPLREICDPLKIPRWLDHAAREAVQEARGPLYVLTPMATGLDDIAREAVRGAPDALVARGLEIAGKIARGEVDGIAGGLLAAEQPLVISGAGYGTAAEAIVAALRGRGKQPAVKWVRAEANSAGLELLRPLPLHEGLERARRGRHMTLIVLENDLMRRAPAAEIESVFAGVEHLVVLDQIEHATTRAAELVLPAAAWTESDGTFINADGVAQRFFAATPAPAGVRASWQWLSGRSLDEVIAAMVADFPNLAAVREAAPAAEFRIAGEKVARETHRASGRTAVLAQIAVSEPKPPEDGETALTYTMEGASVGMAPIPGPLRSYAWAPGWNSPQAQVLTGTSSECRVSGWAAAPMPAVPEPGRRRPGEWWVIRRAHLFGSEELSRLGAAIAELSPDAYVGVNARSGFTAGQQVLVTLDGRGYQVEVRIVPELGDGMACVPSGFVAFDGAGLPGWAQIC